MEYKAIALDIDGTLLCKERKFVTIECKKAIENLQSKGILVIISTGRGRFAAESDILLGLKPDYFVCNNGACIFDKNENIIYEKRFEISHVEALTKICEDKKYQLCFTFEDAYYIYVQYEEFVETYKANAGKTYYLKDGTDKARHLQSMPYGAFLRLPIESRKIFPSLTNFDLKMMELSYSGAYDICLSSTDKSSAVDIILNNLGINWNETVAIGDNMNDIDIISKSGLGIAMGNAVDEVKKAASFVTTSAIEDGVLNAINRFLI